MALRNGLAGPPEGAANPGAAGRAAPGRVRQDVLPAVSEEPVEPVSEAETWG